MLPGLEILWGLLSSYEPLLALEVPMPWMVRGWESKVWMHPALLTLILLFSLGAYFFCLPAMGYRARWAVIQSRTAAVMFLPVSGSESLLAGIQWLHQIITLCLGKPGQHVGGSVSLQLCISWTFAHSPEQWAYALCICRKGTDATWKKMDLVNLATIIQEACGRAANKIQTFCLLGPCLHNNRVLPLGIWACCLIGMHCSACLLKGKECWESHALIL